MDTKTNTRADIHRVENGSIDYDFYMNNAHQIRSHALAEFFAKLLSNKVRPVKSLSGPAPSKLRHSPCV